MHDTALYCLYVGFEPCLVYLGKDSDLYVVPGTKYLFRGKPIECKRRWRNEDENNKEKESESRRWIRHDRKRKKQVKTSPDQED